MLLSVFIACALIQEKKIISNVPANLYDLHTTVYNYISTSIYIYKYLYATAYIGMYASLELERFLLEIVYTQFSFARQLFLIPLIAHFYCNHCYCCCSYTCFYCYYSAVIALKVNDFFWWRRILLRWHVAHSGLCSLYSKILYYCKFLVWSHNFWN